MGTLDALKPFISSIADYVFKPLINYNTNFKDLEEQREKLVDARDRIQHSVDEAERKGEKIENDVSKWLKKADEITEEAQKFLEENGGQWNCLEDLCPNLFQRHQLSEKAKRITDKILVIYGGRIFDRVSYRRSASIKWSSTLPDYVIFESRESIIKKILEALQDLDVKMIGVHGMGGVGKTTLVDEILRQVEEMGLFNKVGKVTVSQKPNLENIQAQLYEILSLEMDQKTRQGKATVIRENLSNKKVLLVLDDMWKGLKLEELGIASKKDGKGYCKTIITSREDHVLSNEMNTDKKFEIKVLSEEESREIFKKIAGEEVETNQELNKIAVEVVKECGSLPVALVAVAKALKGKPLHSWRNALKQLKQPTIPMEIPGVSTEVYSSLALSYEYLQSEEARLLFLLCSMFPEDYEINIEKYLLYYAMGLEFLHGINSLREARDKIFELTDKLKSSGLFLSGKDDEHIKMHDVIRDVAIGISSKNEKMYSMSYGQVELNEWKDKDVKENYTTIWIDFCSMLHNLPKKLRFERLELLALTGNRHTPWNVHIPETLFEGLKNLKVLWAEGMYLFPWPSSFDRLIHLKTLSLIACQLGNIDMISELKELEILNLSQSDIKELPKALDQLTRLKLLDLSYCEQLQVIPPNVILRLTKLEVLHTRGGFDGWEKEDLSYCEGKNASLSELNYLPLLTTLSLIVPDVEILPVNAFSRNLGLESFHIVIGKTFAGFKEYWSSQRMLDIKLDSSVNILLDDGLNKLLKECEDLNLEVGQNGKDVLSELYHLKHLCLTMNSDIAYLIDDFSRKKAFSMLESLRLEEMKGLESLINIHGPLKTLQVFNKLKTIKVFRCHKLRNLFPSSLMKCLSNVEEITVFYCDTIETIFVEESEEEANNKIECRQLRRLWLHGLPQLISICSKLQHSQIVEENHIFTERVAFPNLVELKIYDLSNLSMIWHHRQVFGIEFCNLRTIEIGGCHNLRRVFNCNVMKKLTQIQCLHVSDAYLVEEVFEIQRSDAIEEAEEEGSLASSYKLERLSLSGLPNLKKVWSKDPCGVFNFQCLTSVKAYKCPKLESLFPTSITKDLPKLQNLVVSKCGIREIFDKEEEILKTPQMVSFPQLESIYIFSVDNLEQIWHNQLIVDDLSKLKEVKLYDCKRLKSVFPSKAMRSTIFMKLESLDIESCDSLEEVFGVEEEEEEEGGEIVPINTTNLKLDVHNFESPLNVRVIGCPKLKRLVPMSQAKHFQQQLYTLQVDAIGLDTIFYSQETSQTQSLPTKDAFPNLTKLELKSKKVIRELWESKLSRELFPRLKVLNFDGLDDNEPIDFSLASNQLLYILEELKVNNTSVVEIFSDDEKNERRRRSHALLKRLSLFQLSKLMHIWKGSSLLLFADLEFLEVERCCSLKILLPSSFPNLIDLEISECHGLINLLTSSVAKALVKLQTMTIRECECMTTILTEEDQENEEEDRDGAIVFCKLETLKLHKLSKLKQFHCTQRMLKFPNLKKFSIEECLEMKTLSRSCIYTSPKRCRDYQKRDNKCLGWQYK